MDHMQSTQTLFNKETQMS